MVVGVSLSEPHTSVTALQDESVCMHVGLSVCGHIPKFKLNECMRRYNVHFKFAHVLSSSKFNNVLGLLECYTVGMEGIAGSEDDSS